MSQAAPGDLVPSAQSLKHFFDQELLWKIKLSKPPKHHLEYYFTRPDASDNHLDSYNVEETKVATKDSKHFDQQLTVSLAVKDDGTASPKFVYKAANLERGVKENSVTGRKFYIDMTVDSAEGVLPQNFVGFDFGTSNSSVCLLTQNQIKLRHQRQQNSSWRGLSASLSALPYPVAISVRRFLGETDPGKSVESVREAFESALAFMAYVAASEASASGSAISLKNFQHRSMGPLKDLLQRSLKQLKSNAFFARNFKKLFDKHNDFLNKAVDDFNDHKHHKLRDNGADWHAYLELPVRIIASMMENFLFGYCATSEPEGFDEGFAGKFVVAQDNAPFVNSFNYSSGRAINQSIAILKDIESDRALSLTPFLFWANADQGMQAHSCYWLDKFQKEVITVKPCNELQCYEATAIDQRIDQVSKKLFEKGETVYGSLTITEVTRSNDGSADTPCQC